MMNHPQSVKIDESLDSGLRSSRKKPNGIVIFDNEGVMWYREVHETKLSKFNVIISYYSVLTLILHRTSYLAR